MNKPVRTTSSREVSVKSDEPLCRGTLLELDVKSLEELNFKDDIKRTLHCRMKLFWHLVEKRHGISQHILFCGSGKLPSPGYHWAPATLLKEQNSAQRALYIAGAGGRAQIDSRGRGIFAELAGMLIASTPQTVDSLKRFHERIGTMHSGTDVLSSQVCQLRDQEDRWFRWNVDSVKSQGNFPFEMVASVHCVQHRIQTDREANTEDSANCNCGYGIIIKEPLEYLYDPSRPGVTEPVGDGLLVEIKKQDGECIFSKWIRHRWLRIVPHKEAKIFEAAYKIAEEISRTETMEFILRNQEKNFVSEMEPEMGNLIKQALSKIYENDPTVTRSVIENLQTKDGRVEWLITRRIKVRLRKLSSRLSPMMTHSSSRPKILSNS